MAEKNVLLVYQVDMEKEHSCGIIPLRSTNMGWEVLLIRHRRGSHWAFPKGHAEEGEDEKATAVRELKEETGAFVIRFLPFDPFEESYFFTKNHKKVHKTVTYFAAIVTETITLQKEEVSDHLWLSLDDAYAQVTFPETKRLCKETKNCLDHMQESTT